MNVLSICDGISCGMVALEKAGIHVENYYAFEIDKNAIKISKHNYPNIIQCGDVTIADFKKYKNIDLLIGGTPCQDLACCNQKGKGLDGERSKLFFDYVRALHDTKPKYFLFENVARMKNKDREIITEVLGVEPILIDSALLSAQSRKRLYWTNIPNVELPNDSGIILSDILENDNEHSISCALRTRKNYDQITSCKHLEVRKDNKANALTTVRTDSMICSPIQIGKYGKGGQGQRIYSVEGKSVTISANSGGIGQKTGLYRIDLPDGDYVVRRLTERECERLQTLPDGYTNCGLSWNQRVKAIGNGWTVDVIAHILSFINKS